MTLHANGFDWDKGNRAKCEKHGLFVATIEDLFARPLAVLPDEAHSQREKRFRAVGHTDKGRRADPTHQRSVHAQEGGRRV